MIYYMWAGNLTTRVSPRELWPPLLLVVHAEVPTEALR